jgi:flagellar motor switch protein FliG
LSDLVDFEDLGLLDGGDLRAVLDHVPLNQVLDAFAGTTPGLRRSLLSRLSPASAAQLEAQIAAHGPVSFESARSAQRAIVEAICELSRAGQIAFDDPADMVA